MFRAGTQGGILQFLLTWIPILRFIVCIQQKYSLVSLLSECPIANCRTEADQRSSKYDEAYRKRPS